MFLNINMIRRARTEGMKRAAYDYRRGVQRMALGARGQSTVATMSLPECIDRSAQNVGSWQLVHSAR